MWAIAIAFIPFELNRSSVLVIVLILSLMYLIIATIFTKPCDSCSENEVCNLLDVCECDSDYIRDSSTESCVGELLYGMAER